jgi:hypothetical protein
MTQQELIDLEVERQALLHTILEMSKGDARMETGLDQFLRGLENRAKEIQQIIINEMKIRHE